MIPLVGMPAGGRASALAWPESVADMCGALLPSVPNALVCGGSLDQTGIPSGGCFPFQSGCTNFAFANASYVSPKFSLYAGASHVLTLL